MAQWIAHRTSNPGVAGSSPAQGKTHVFFFFFFFYIHLQKQNIRDGVVGNISACHADARGSIPRRGEKFK